MSKFYVYLYIDPRNGIVRYVGKGKRDRINHKRTKNKLVEHWIQEFKESNFRPIKIKIKENLTEDAAHQLERSYISLFGRVIFNKENPEEGRTDGTLYNICAGGEGACGRKMSEEVKKKTFKNPIWIKNNKLAMQRRAGDPVWQENHRLQERYAGPRNGRKYKGVFWDKSRSKFRVSIQVGSKCQYLGRFNTQIDAALAYNEAVDKYWGGNGYKNTI
jgi:hypothetical protein